MPDLARLLVTLTDGLTLAWLADRDDAAAERSIDHAADAISAFAREAVPHDRHAAATQPAAPLSPVRRADAAVTGGWIAAFATAWLGIWMAQLTPSSCCSRCRSTACAAPRATGSTRVVAFGIISGIAGVCALIAYPLTGALSDRTTSRFGRRRPWILGGALAFAVSLVLLGLQTTIVGIGVFWSLALTGFCVLTAALTATISDQVPVRQRGFVSGWISAPQAVGTILGLLLVTARHHVAGARLRRLAVLLLVLVVPFLFFVKDAVLPREQRPKLTAGAVARAVSGSPRKYPDFGWTLLSRILVNLGNALGTTLLLYFLISASKLTDAEDDLLILIAHLHGLRRRSRRSFLGRLTDRIGRRKLFVTFAAALQARPRCCSPSCPTSPSRWSPPACSASATAASSRSTRRSRRRCCPTPPTAARTSAS